MLAHAHLGASVVRLHREYLHRGLARVQPRYAGQDRARDLRQEEGAVGRRGAGDADAHVRVQVWDSGYGGGDCRDGVVGVGVGARAGGVGW